MGLRGPDIRPGHDNRHFIIKGHRGFRRSRKVMDGLFPSLDLHFWSEKLGVGGWWIIVSAPVPVPFLFDFGLGFGIWIWDLDFGLGFWTGLGLDNSHNYLKK